MTGITINNVNSEIDAGDNKVLNLASKGAVKVGDGTYLTGNTITEIAPKAEYEGCLRYNENTQTLEICTKTAWIPLGGDLHLDNSIVWGMIFSGK